MLIKPLENDIFLWPLNMNNSCCKVILDFSQLCSLNERIYSFNFSSNVTNIVSKSYDGWSKITPDSLKSMECQNSFRNCFSCDFFIEPKLVFVEGGFFKMGNQYSAENVKPSHNVVLSSFYIGKYEVTQAEWRSVMGNNPSRFIGCENCPVEQVSWEDIQDYINKLNSQTGKNYRLPTEAEWEYAAKGGNKSCRYNYSGSHNLNLVGWYWDNSFNKTSAVGTKQANELGLCDMSGNVWEWCSDWYGPYSAEEQINPQGPENGVCRVLRGGSCFFGLSESSSEFRNLGDPVSRGYDCGFRLVLPVSP
jgi:formylglycine-generating enzyme required for sulfatase activity